MTKKTLILDFDGTLTDLSKQGSQYQQLYLDEFAKRSGTSRIDLESIANILVPKILPDPMKGWRVNGRIMAPAGADPYMLYEAVFDEISNSMGMDEGESEQIRKDCFYTTYPKCEPCFREGIFDFLKLATEKYNVTIVSNSKTEQIEQKLKELGITNIPVKGNAQKYLPTPYWTAIPEHSMPNGFLRPVELRRKHYGDALLSVEAYPSNTIVLGDIYEMDLALPEHLGASTIQISNGFTLLHEFKHMISGKNRHYAMNLEDAAKILQL